jgi:hypothetical protein
VKSALLGPTMPAFWVYNPAYDRIQNEHIWGAAWGEILDSEMTPQAAAERAFKRGTSSRNTQSRRLEQIGLPDCRSKPLTAHGLTRIA